MATGDSSNQHVSVQVFEEFDGLVSHEQIRDIAMSVLALEGHETDELSIVIADDETVRDLNRQHRGLDENTDVLSFAFSNQGEYYGDEPHSEWTGDGGFVMPPGEEPGLGEVIISYPQASRQAEEAGHAVQQEMTHLVAHGVLHLLGHDHMKPDEEAAMKASEKKALAQVLEHE